MLVFDKIAAFKDHLNQYSKGSIIGFVPTMGALHEGHLHLVSEAKKSCNIVVVSIFVNPLQFNNSSDFDKYPITIEKDKALLEEIKCDLLFIPNATEIYSQKTRLKFDFGTLEQVMEGKFRPGHFNGVAIVLSKLFHIVSPTIVYFGQKDFQQCAVVKTLIEDLSFNMKMITVPTVREASGLAMSSRNQRLSQEGLSKASSIFAGLSQGMQVLKETRNKTKTKEQIQKIVEAACIEVEYIEIADPKTLLPADTDLRQMVICFAGFLEGVRLIDNIVVDL